MTDKPSLKHRLQAAWHCLKGKQVLFNVDIHETIGLTNKDNISVINVKWNCEKMQRSERGVHLIAWLGTKHNITHKEGNVVNILEGKAK